MLITNMSWNSDELGRYRCKVHYHSMALNVSIDVGSGQSYMKFEERLKVGKQLSQI